MSVLIRLQISRSLRTEYRHWRSIAFRSTSGGTTSTAGSGVFLA
jgi:hypothetical protein